MSLEPAAEPAVLYQALGAEVNAHRPVFTGDIFAEVFIAGIATTAAIVIAHPCSIRGRNGRLERRISVASVQEHPPSSAERWAAGFFNRMPLEGLALAGDFHVAWLDRFGLADTEELLQAERLACLSHPGSNLLQQRLVFHLTRLAVPTRRFHAAFAHTYLEADLLEEWSTELAGIDTDHAASFPTWIQHGDPSRQDRLR